MAYKRAQDCSNRLSYLREKKCEFQKGRPENHISGSGTGSLHHNPFKLDQWHHDSFQMSPSLFKSVQQSLRNRSRFCVDGYVTYSVISPKPKVSGIVRSNSINGISRAFKWVQVCSNRFSHLWEKWEHKLCLEKVHMHTHTHTYTHIHTHTDIFRSRRAESNGI